jgi:uncharacterized protein YbaR (Trm112 family)
MPIDKELLEILCCPRTKVPVRVMPADQLAKLNERIAAGEVKYYDSSPVDKPLQEGLITDDGETVYRIDDGIPVMLVEQGIPGRQIEN